MKFSFSAIAIAAAFAFVNAQDLSGIPTCALACFATAVGSTDCSLTDTNCQCTTGKDKITESITACVPTKCSTEDIAKLAPAVAAICAKEGVTITDIPTAVATASGGSGSASRTASVSGTGTATGSAAGATNSTGAASANGVTFGLAAGIMGVAAWL